jgi:hypothetical protein
VLEAAHRERCGTEYLFCYVESHWMGSLYRLSIVEEENPGHSPVTEDIAYGTHAEMHRLADLLNRQHLGLTPHQTAIIVASSMYSTGKAGRRPR